MKRGNDLGFFFRWSIYFRQILIFFRTLIYLKNPYLLCAQFLNFVFYIFRSPYRMIDKVTNPYGETPYFTLDKIAKKFGILSSDRVLDLGCGRGLGVIFWNQHIKAEAFGVDNYQLFIKRANCVKKILCLDRIHYKLDDFFEYPLKDISVIYLYGTCLSDDAIAKMIERFVQLDSNTKIITVSYPLSDFSSKFNTEKQIIGVFPWGTSPIFLNRKNFY